MFNVVKIQKLFISKSYYEILADQQKAYLEKLGDASDDIERSYKQYKCQRCVSTWYVRSLCDGILFFVIPFLVLVLFIKSLFVRKQQEIKCLGDFVGMEEILPDELHRQYNVNNEHWNEGAILKFSDIRYVLKFIIRYPLSPMFSLKCLIKLARYSYLYHVYSAQVIIVHNEYSYTSSLLTDYCHFRGIKHINVMHGEKLAIIRDSYFHYDKCYVWDDYYIKLFISLKAEPTQFIISLPKSMRIDRGKYTNENDFADYKYYLNSSDENKLVAIKKSLAFVAKEGKTVKYRPHPRYSNISVVERILGKENIEYPNRTSILSSIANCGCVISSYSTVLNQAYHSGIDVLIDDVAEKEMYDKLKMFRYILISNNIPCLSQKQVEMIE